MKNQKMLTYIAIISLIIAVFIIFIGYDRKESSDQPSKYLQTINYKTFNKLLNDKASFILYIGNRDCSHCKEFAPNLKAVLNKYKVYVKYIDTYTLSNDEKNSLQSTVNINGTPTVIFIKKGEEESTLNRIVGAIPQNEIIDYLKTNEYIK